MLVNETRNTTQTHGNVSHGEEEEGHTHTLLTNMVVAGGMAHTTAFTFTSISKKMLVSVANDCRRHRKQVQLSVCRPDECSCKFMNGLAVQTHRNGKLFARFMKNVVSHYTERVVHIHLRAGLCAPSFSLHNRNG